MLEWTAFEIRGLRERFLGLETEQQQGIAIELELLWPEDYGLSPQLQAMRFVERAEEYDLLPSWLELVDYAEGG